MKTNRVSRYIKIFFRSTALLVNLGAMVWLFLCLYASYKNVADRPSPISLFSFTNLFAVFVNIGFVFFWLFSRKRLLSLLSLVTLLMCWRISSSVFGFNLFSGNIISKENVELKVMTWNVHLFDLGEWSKNREAKDKMIEFIKDQDADILCLLEFYFDNDNPDLPYTDILKQLGYTYYVFSKEEDLLKRTINISAGKTDYIQAGHAVFSKFPLKNSQRYPLNDRYYNMLGVDVQLNDSAAVRLNVLHLHSVTFSDEDVRQAEKKADKIPTKIDSEAKGLLYKLMMASSKRAAQANQVDSILSRSTLPNLACGDFNDLPGSYVYSQVRGSLKDAFVSKGLGFGRTYRKIFGTLRIDYILYDEQLLNCRGYANPNINLSDHNPVIATFTIK